MLKQNFMALQKSTFAISLKVMEKLEETCNTSEKWSRSAIFRDIIIILIAWFRTYE